MRSAVTPTWRKNDWGRNQRSSGRGRGRCCAHGRGVNGKRRLLQPDCWNQRGHVVESEGAESAIQARVDVEGAHTALAELGVAVGVVLPPIPTVADASPFDPRVEGVVGSCAAVVHEADDDGICRRHLERLSERHGSHRGRRGVGSRAIRRSGRGGRVREGLVGGQRL